MRHYKMASVINPSIIKQPLKFVEIPLSKFSEEVIPHHQSLYDQYKFSVQKLISVNNIEQLQRDVKDKKRTVKQLRDLMYELDTLRTQVEDADLDKFDSKTLSLRKIIINLINGYLEWEKKIYVVINAQLEDSEKENLNPFEEASQIQMTENLEELKLKDDKNQLYKVENIQRDVNDLNEMYQNLNDMVGSHAEKVDTIQQSVDSTQQNVESGTKELGKAYKLKAVAYPVTGAFLGGAIGGPIGLVAGLKIGGIVAIGCAIAGYTGGKFLNKMNKTYKIQTETECSATDTESCSTSQKKDI